MLVSLIFTEGGARDLIASGLTVEQVKQSVVFTIETVARYKYLEYDYFRCEPIDVNGRRFQPSGGIFDLDESSISFECSGITELFQQTVQNPDGTETVEWLPKNDSPTIRELIEQRKQQE